MIKNIVWDIGEPGVVCDIKHRGDICANRYTECRMPTYSSLLYYILSIGHPPLLPSKQKFTYFFAYQKLPRIIKIDLKTILLFLNKKNLEANKNYPSLSLCILTGCGVVLRHLIIIGK